MQVLIVVAYKCVHQNKMTLGKAVTKIVGQVDRVQQRQTDQSLVCIRRQHVVCIMMCCFLYNLDV